MDDQTKLLLCQNNDLHSAFVVTEHTIDVGSGILEELGKQKETTKRSIDRSNKMISMSKKARNIVSKMERNERYKKIVLFVIAIILLIIIFCIIWFS